MRESFSKAAAPAALLTALLTAASFPVAAADNLGEAFTQGKFGYNFRWRFEDVDQTPLPNNAYAMPLRARINFHTDDLYGWSAKAEFDYVFHFGVDSFRAGGGNTPNPAGYPVIADPGGEDLNQAFIQYKSANGIQARLGRQRIIFDNARFVGNVGWRQNEQTYDSFSLDHTAGNGVRLQYAYVDNVNRIFGNDVAAGDHSQNTHLFNASFPIKKIGKLTGYYYAVDNEDAAGLSSNTLGVRFSGKGGGAYSNLGYVLEYAGQQDAADNPVSYTASYYRVDVSVKYKWATVYGGFESLGGDNSKPGQAFRTPLATLHAFNGWADKFLATPGAGLNDVFFGAKGKFGQWNWNLLYHDFSAESGSANFGSEIDTALSRKFKDHFGILVKAALFNTSSRAYGDTNKLWIQLTANY